MLIILLILLGVLLDSGHSVILVEHNPQVLRSADWILEMGPGAGIDGGNIVATRESTFFAGERYFDIKIYIFRHSFFVKFFKAPYSQNNKAKSFHCRCKENNLKNLDLKIPHGKFVVVTGPSGSGKSSLAFDVIFAEGQRRFMESMSAMPGNL